MFLLSIPRDGGGLSRLATVRSSSGETPPPPPAAGKEKHWSVRGVGWSWFISLIRAGR